MTNAIVTGASSGIGKAVAVALAEDGFDLGVTYASDQAGANSTRAEVEALGRSCAVRQVDLQDVGRGADVVDELADELGGVDVLVHNAGTGGGGPFLELDLETWRHTLTVDLDAAFTVMQAGARRMADAGTPGRIIAVTSVHEHVPKSGSAAYCAAKGGLGMLVKVAALELAPVGITVNAVAPGEIATKMTDQHDEDPTEQGRSMIPVGRPGHAAEIAAAVRFLASEPAAYTTGSSMVVDGGLTLMSAEANQRATADQR
jgi:NAD(P)-dependent dehydrogenase (short-subunit alcohol dehydrogenase family)